MWWVFPKGALSHWVQWVRFALQKLSVTWQSRGIFLCIPFLAIVVRSVTTDSDAFLFSKKVISECLRATQWKFDYSPSEKQLLKYWLLDGFTIVSFCFWKDTSAASAICSCFCFCCWGFGACLNKVTKWEFITVVKKYPLCILAYFFLNLWTFSRNLKKLPLD